ncbi:hypothetical protein EJ08DRAFT_673239 [Tothia fuscella]|uniref:Saccharopine dehydrogenase NADP binding domain-containing protein n=1 Tax=Tothia fuscella TaxID=1048955 RepID=A0A9P4NG24_9PEZI|nr:hypothetical protein EJ08DRAFT_673239 [Tothia fuscella]
MVVSYTIIIRKLLIYGATGYTGQLASEHAKSIGLEFIVPGRASLNLQNLASTPRVQYRNFNVTDSSEDIDAYLKDIGVLLNCAGPFHRTAKPLMEACIRNGVHYLDIAAEIMMLMPGCGSSVTMLGCLAMYLIERSISPVSIDIALHVAGPISWGSAISAQKGALITKDGEKRKGKPLQSAESATGFDFGDGRGLVECSPIILPDLIAIPRATRVSSVRTYVYIYEVVFPRGDLADMPNGPTAVERDANPYHAAVEVGLEDGYSFTAITLIKAAKQVLVMEVFGSGFVESIEGSIIQIT